MFTHVQRSLQLRRLDDIDKTPRPRPVNSFDPDKSKPQATDVKELERRIQNERGWLI